jgi:uncharacterized protein (DUF1501 family)
MHSRRRFLGSSLRSLPLISLAPTLPGFLAQTARASGLSTDDRVLVVLQLDGGNDGLNTVVPFADEAYAKHRKALRLQADRVLKIADGIGLHPAMGDAAKLLESGRLAIVQGVGYPNPNRSHFASMATWHTARLDPEEHGGSGWIGRGLDSRAGESAVYVGGGTFPSALRSRRTNATAIDRIEDLQLDPGSVSKGALTSAASDSLVEFARRSALDAYAASDRLSAMGRGVASSPRYPATDLGRRLSLASRLLKGGFGARVFYLNQTGYDTHSSQLGAHASLLSELFTALRAFLDELAESKLADRVLVLCFSEFGRRVAENASEGTDHGTAGPVFVAGAGVRSGLIGSMPDLSDVASGDLKTSIDFRRIYATLLDGWLDLPTLETLGGAFEALPLLRA